MNSPLTGEPAMQLEDYFEFHTEPVEHIRIKGTRIGLEHVIFLYTRGMFPEQIAVNFACPITVEQAYAAITYYLHNKEAVEGYLERVRAAGDANYQKWLAREPSEAVKRIRAIKAAREAGTPTG
jgi:uncharacterized protein (DUF433 family)